jgi:hypothetical protein
MKIMSKPEETLSIYPNKYSSTIALGATPIGSAGRTPDDQKIIDYYGGVKI